MEYPHGHSHHGPDRREEYPPPVEMEYPHGYPHSHHGPGRREEEYPPPPPPRPHPPPFYGENPPPPPFYGENPPPPPFYGENPPPPPFYGGSAPPPPYYGENEPPPPRPQYPPPPPIVSHKSEDHQHHHHPHVPSFVSHKSHQNSEVANKPAVRVYSKAETNYSLTIRDGKVILAPSNPSDPFQHWVKDEKYSTRVKDEEGFPSFALINKATGQAMKHSIGATHPVQLTPHNSDVLDESILWTLSRDLGDGYRTIRMVNNIRLNVDALNGDKNHGGVHDGTTIVLWEWKKGENQRWKIVFH